MVGRRISRAIAGGGWLALLSLIAFAQWQIALSHLVAPGVIFQEITRSDPPTRIGVVRLTRPLPPHLALRPFLGQEPKVGRAPLSSTVAQIQETLGYVTAAINGDYFSLQPLSQPADPLGLHIVNGELISLPHSGRSALVGTKDGRLLIAAFNGAGIVRWSDGRQETIRGLNQPLGPNGWFVYSHSFGLTTGTPPGTWEILLRGNGPLRANLVWEGIVEEVTTEGNRSLPEGCLVLARNLSDSSTAPQLSKGDRVRLEFRIRSLDEPCDPDQIEWSIGGGPRLLRRGVPYVAWAEEGFSRSFSETPHPRTAVGLKKDALFFVVVDGRQPGYSNGMTLPELAQFLKGLGCEEGLNLDGGGSTTLYLRGRIANRPSDGKERAIANGLALLNLFPPQPIIRLIAEAPFSHWLVGSSVPITVRAEDAAYRLFVAKGDSLTVRWEPPLPGIAWSGDGLLTGPQTVNQSPEKVTVLFSVPDGSAEPASLTLYFHRAPESVSITPATILATPNGSVSLKVESWGRDPSGKRVPIQFDPSLVQWTVDPQIGRVEGSRLVFGPDPRPGLVVAAIGGVTATASVLLRQPSWVLVNELENLSDLSFQKIPETVEFTPQVVSFPKSSGQGALRLSYDFSQGEGTRAGYVFLSRALPKGTIKLSLMVFGDGQGCWLRARLRSANGDAILLDLAPSINWSQEWREVQADLPAALDDGVRLEAIYLVAFRTDHKPKGSVVLDLLRCLSPNR
ncbi:MAG: phosphodiester glycosidase family protein [Armatimonadetes bacterium]|nr:phosphodiester glycosidase family protein [Armatimonadota bacterium]MDW8121085.1 phosphodiester glycosidase family protein [Armatimonadota bacterium]